MQRGVAKGLKVPCLFMITEVSIRCQKNPEVGIRRIPPQYTTGPTWLSTFDKEILNCSTKNALQYNFIVIHFHPRKNCINITSELTSSLYHSTAL